MSIIRADNFYPWRNGGSIRTVYTWSITDMSFGPCPSGYGTAVQRPVSGTTAGGGSFRFTIPTGQVTTEYGASAIYTINIDPASTTWWSVIGFNRSGSNDFLRVQYQPSTNKWRVTRDLNIIIGAVFDGPADVKQPFEIAMEAKRDAAAGYFRVWFNGVLAYEITNVNTGIVNAISLLLPNLYFPGVSNTGGLVTASNWIVWNPLGRPYPGRRIIETLELVGDVQKQWTNPASVPAFGRLILSPTGSSPTVQATAIGQTNIYAVRDLADLPDVIETLFLHRHQVTGTIETSLVQAGGTKFIDSTAFGDFIINVPTDHAGQPWTRNSINDVRISQMATALNTGSPPVAQMQHLHALVVRSPGGTPVVPAFRGRAFIMSS
jgi:hypothetical protein